MKKIIFIIPSLEAVSPVRAALGLIKGINTQYDILVISINSPIDDKKTIKEELEELRIRYIYLNSNGIKNIFMAKNKLQKIVNNENPDILISYLLRADIINSLIKVDFAKKISSIRNMIEKEYVISHGKLIGNIFGFFHKYALSQLDKIILMSNDMYDFFIKNKFEQNKLALIHNCLDEDDLQKKMSVSYTKPFDNNLPIIVSVGSLIPRKNTILLVNNCLKLLTEGFAFNVLIIGDGEERKILESKINESSYKNNFKFTGNINNPIPFILNSNIFVMTSISEGVSRSLMEALYLGKTSIVSDIDGNRELIDNNINGYLYKTDTEFLNYLKLLINNLKNEKVNLLKKEFSYENSISKHLELFSNLEDK